MVLTCEYFVADLNDQLVTLIVEPLAGIVRIGLNRYAVWSSAQSC
jgi:hypothetical protein